VYPSTESVVRNFIATQTMSRVGSVEPDVRGQVKDYDYSPTMTARISRDVSEFKAVDDEFKTLVGSDGKPFIETARKYWEDPEFAEEQRRKIAEGKTRKS
jgi:hypothetical protein